MSGFFVNFMWPILAFITLMALIILVRIMTSFYVKVPPHKAAFFYGAKSGQKKGGDTMATTTGVASVRVLPAGTVVVTGGGRLRKPIIEAVEFLDLSEITLQVQTKNMANKDGVLITVEALANIRFKDDADSLLIAGGRFLGKTAVDIRQTAQETLESNLRGVIGRLTVEELINDREKFRTEVLKEAGEDLARLGIQIDVFNPQSITDTQGYIEALGKKRTAEVQRDASIGEAEAQAEAKKRSTTAAQQAEVVNQENEKIMAEATKRTDVARQQFFAEVATETATASQAGPLATARAKQSVVVAEVKIEEEQARALIAVEEQNIKREEKKQEADVVVPAKAKADAQVKEALGYQLAQEARASGDNKAIILRADAESHKRKVEGEGLGVAIEAEGLAKAKVTRQTGLAEAEVIKQKLLSEAEGLLKKAEAYKQFSQAAILLEVVRELPPVVTAFASVFGAIAAPMSNIDKVIVYDGGGSGDGKDNSLTRLAMMGPKMISQLLDSAQAMGFDIEGLLNLAKIKVEAVDKSVSTVDGK
ncbi:MAG: SPFH domain-containing protein [Candidatus Zixiibacteriota bacterium]